MLNMIKYQFYRFSRNLSTYVTPVLLIMFNIMLVAMNASTPIEKAGGTVLSDYMTITEFASFSFATMGFTMAYGVWVAIYGYGEFQKGYIRNIASSVKNKCSFFLSHMLVCIVMFAICAVIGSVSAMVSAKLMVADMRLGDLLFLGKFLLMQLYIHLTLAALILFVVYLSRNAFIPIIVAFALTMGLESLPLLTVQNFIDKTLGANGAELNSWLNHTAIYNNIFMLEVDMWNGGSMHKYFIVGGVMLVIYSVIACLAITKKDIK